jgi:hypothetical protein
MKNQTIIQSATLTFAINDLQLLQEALIALELVRYTLGRNKKENINRLYNEISIVINNNVSTSN